MACYTRAELLLRQLIASMVDYNIATPLEIVHVLNNSRDSSLKLTLEGIADGFGGGESWKVYGKAGQFEREASLHVHS